MNIEKNTTKLERIYFSIIRWTVLIATTLAFIGLIGGALYSAYLYKESKNTTIQEKTYLKKLPQMNYDEIMKEEEAIRMKEAQVKSYVLKVINKGSFGHGYSMGNMTPVMMPGTDADQVADYISKHLMKNKPAGFASCTSCHGNNGEGMSGIAPDLRELPIYNGKRKKIVTAKEVIKQIESEPEEVKSTKSPMEKMLDKITANINRYALRVGQTGIGRDDMYTYLKSPTVYIDNKTDYITKLEDASTKLLKYGKEFSKIKHVEEAVNWNNFITSFSLKYSTYEAEELQKERKIEKENQRKLNEQKDNALEAQISLLVVISGVGIALGIFFALILILILIKIERNTRKIGKEKEDENE